jgi:uncharacterized protein (DUF488 family)
VIFSLGYAERDFECVATLLRRLDIKAVIDVRSSPFSGHYPNFNRDRIESPLAAEGIAYYSLGHQLGPRVPEDEHYGEDGQVDFRSVAKSKRFSAGLDRLFEIAKRGHVAIMCAEKSPTVCHRGLLVAHAVFSAGKKMSHILSDDSVISHEKFLDNLCEEQSIVVDLFDDQLVLRERAIDLQSKKHAYRRA